MHQGAAAGPVGLEATSNESGWPDFGQTWTTEHQQPVKLDDETPATSVPEKTGEGEAPPAPIVQPVRWGALPDFTGTAPAEPVASPTPVDIGKVRNRRWRWEKKTYVKKNGNVSEYFTLRRGSRDKREAIYVGDKDDRRGRARRAGINVGAV